MGFSLFKKKKKENITPAAPVIPEKPTVLTKEEIIYKILGGEFSSFIELKSETRGDSIYIPELEMSIKPLVFEIRDRMVSLGFDMYSDVLKTSFFECSVGLGGDSSSAYGMAIGTFAFSFMQGLKVLADNDVKYKITSEFAGHSHSWSVYESNIVGTAINVEQQKISKYWELLKDDIIKRLGNQKVTYVKIFNSKNDSTVIGECRINDIAIPELGDKVAEIARKWDSQGFASQKQFFFIVQDDNTIADYPYAGKEGQEKLRSNVVEYLKIFSNIKSKEEYDNIIETTAAVTGDKTLANECMCFIPEMCAEKYFEDTFICGDHFDIAYPDGSVVPSYKCQLSDYIPIKEAVFHTFSSGILGEHTNRVFGQMVEMSSLNNIINQVKKENDEPKGLRVNCVIHNVTEDFEVR